MTRVDPKLSDDLRKSHGSLLITKRPLWLKCNEQACLPRLRRFTC